MSPLALLFSVQGRIDRGAFIAGAVGTVATFALLIYGSEQSLGWMAGVLAPRGINAGLVLNVIWLVLGLLAVWALIALFAKRLRDRGRSGWWAAAAILPLAALAVLNDALFLVSRAFALPPLVYNGVLILAAAIGVWVMIEALLPGTRNT